MLLFCRVNAFDVVAFPCTIDAMYLTAHDIYATDVGFSMALLCLKAVFRFVLVQTHWVAQ